MKTIALVLTATAPLIGLWVSSVFEDWRHGVLTWAGWSFVQGSIGALMLWRYW